MNLKIRTRYLLRLDDACSTMAKFKWQRMETILDKYRTQPLVGIIPNNEDPQQMIDPINDNFWAHVREWQRKGWAIALHGYDHCYVSNGGLKGLNPIWSRSEFAGLPLEAQKEKIRKGVEILERNGINAEYFFAPSHTFDNNTLTALLEESKIRIISDTIAAYPYRRGEFTFIPQIGGKCRTMPLPGIRTFCLHPSTMSEQEFEKVESFIRLHRNHIMSFKDLDLTNLCDKTIVDKTLNVAYRTYRLIRGKK